MPGAVRAPPLCCMLPPSLDWNAMAGSTGTRASRRSPPRWRRTLALRPRCGALAKQQWASAHRKLRGPEAAEAAWQGGASREVVDWKHVWVVFMDTLICCGTDADRTARAWIRISKKKEAFTSTQPQLGCLESYPVSMIAKSFMQAQVEHANKNRSKHAQSIWP